MKKSLFTSVFTAMVFAMLISGCGSSKDQAPQQRKAMPYPVVTIPADTIVTYTSYPTSLQGIVDSEVRAKASGYITEVLVDAGEKVKKGQILFRIETQALTEDASAAQANINAAQVEVNKLEPLVEKNIISSAQLETAKARLAQAKANYQSIVANIDYATVRSPVDGYVGNINLREGALVSPTSQTPLTTVADISKVYAFFSLNEKEYLDFIQNAKGEDLDEKIKNLPKVRLVLANGELYPIEGTIETISAQVNATTGSISFRAIFDNPNRLLTSGYSGRIEIPKQYDNATLVPATSTFERQGITYVYIVEGDSLAVSSTLDIVDRVDNILVVRDGVNPGDKIVAKGVSKLRTNTPIVPQEVEFDSIARGLKQAFK